MSRLANETFRTERRTAYSEPQSRSESGDAGLALLFSDIEGSTQLVESLGGRYSALLARHFELLEWATEAARWREGRFGGDAFFAVFDDSLVALQAAIAAQRALYEEPWPEGARVRVRIGLHTGHPQLVLTPETQYFGIDVHRAARICEAANGGQILLSNATRSIVDGRLPPGVSLRDLGTHRLRDIRFPENLSDLIIEGLPSHFAPIRSIDNRPTNLPADLTPFIGRADDKSRLLELLNNPSTRLVTLTGAGGSGKTRLAIEVAKNLINTFPDGVFQVQLATVNVWRLVAPTIAQTLGIPEFPGRSVTATITQAIGTRRMLLIIDNFEQVLPAASTLVEILSECPNLKMVVTSREALNLASEREYSVPPLQTPEILEGGSFQSLMSSDAVRLLVDRIQAISPEFQATSANAPVLATLCRRLDGLPLAIELAATRLRVLDPEALLRRVLEHRDTLGPDGWALGGRHRTMRNAISWSFNLLEEEEQQFFCVASVFTGGFSLESAEALFKAQGRSGNVFDLLTSLVRKNLLRRETVDGEVRLHMFGVMSDFAREQLKERGGQRQLRYWHMMHMLNIAETMAPALATRNQRRSVEKLLRESDNIRAALDFAIEERDADAISRFLRSLLWLWISRSLFTEGDSWIGRALQLTEEMAGSRERAIVVDVAGWFRLISGSWAGAVPFFKECRPIYQRLDMVRESTLALMMEGITSMVSTPEPAAREQVDTALTKFRETNDAEGIGLTLTALGEFARLEGEHARAEECFTEALECMRSVGNTYWTLALLENLAHVHLHHGDWRRASALLDEAHVLGEDYEDPMLANAYLAAMGQVALLRGHPEEAARLFGATDAFLNSAGVKFAPADQVQYEQSKRTAENVLGTGLFEQRLNEGAKLTVRRAIATAASLLPEGVTGAQQP